MIGLRCKSGNGFSRELLIDHIIRQILDEIEILEVTPWPGPPAVKKIKDNLYRLRSGSYRIIYERKKSMVYVLRIVDRKELERTLQKLF